MKLYLAFLLFFGVCITVFIQKSSGTYTLQPLPAEPKYKSSDTAVEDEGLETFNDLVRGFISLVLPSLDDIVDDMKKLLNKGFSISGAIDLGISKLLGLLIVLGIGILFIIVFPIVGCCFCCCRQFCKCCCTKPDTEDPKASCKRKVYGVFLFVFIAFTFDNFSTVFLLVPSVCARQVKIAKQETPDFHEGRAGNICTYISNNRITSAIDQVSTSTRNNLDDIDSFVHHTVNQVEKIQDNFDAAKIEIESVLDEQKMKASITNQSLSVFNVKSLDGLQKNINGLKKATSDLNTSLSVLTSAGITTGNPFSIPSIPPSMDNISGEATKQLFDVIDRNLNALTTESAAIKTKLNDAQTQVHDVVTDLKNTVNSSGSLDIDGVKKTVDDIVTTVKPYDKYRWYGGLGCAGIVTLIVGLSIIGIVFGSIGKCGANGDPTEKGCAANSGGRLIISSVAFLFLFGSLLMLLTTVLFVPGSILERYVCQPVTDPNLLAFEKVLNGSFSVTDILPYEAGYTPSLGSLLQNCKKNQGVYEAFSLQHLSGNVIKIDEMEKTINNTKTEVKSKLQNVTSSLAGPNLTSSTQLLPPTLESAMKALSTNFDSSTLQQMSHQVNQLENVVKALQPSNPAALDAVKNMRASVNQMEVIRPKLSAGVTKVIAELNAATVKLQQNDALKTLANSFINDILRIVDVFNNFTKKAIHHDMGKCRPIYNVYNSIISVSLCSYTVDSLNGFWFSIGWCIFFSLPMAVFGTKLSNLMRNVDFVKEGCKTKADDDLKRPQRKSRAKVGHKDTIV